MFQGFTDAVARMEAGTEQTKCVHKPQILRTRTPEQFITFGTYLWRGERARDDSYLRGNAVSGQGAAAAAWGNILQHIRYLVMRAVMSPSAAWKRNHCMVGGGGMKGILGHRAGLRLGGVGVRGRREIIVFSKLISVFLD
jgi:hypothetical protein